MTVVATTDGSAILAGNLDGAWDDTHELAQEPEKVSMRMSWPVVFGRARKIRSTPILRSSASAGKLVRCRGVMEDGEFCRLPDKACDVD